jgi:hypothetical protein
MRRWTTALCLLSTGIYTLILPNLLIASSLLIKENQTVLALYLVPPTMLICCSAAWYSLARGALGRARLLCFLPATLLVLSHFFLK